MATENMSVLQFVLNATDVTEKSATEIFYNYRPDIEGYRSIKIDDPFNLTDEHREFALQIIDIYKAPDFYGYVYDDTVATTFQIDGQDGSFVRDDTDIDTESDYDDENISLDPFFYSKKLDLSEIKNYTTRVNCNYYCSICATDASCNELLTGNGLQLSCSKNNSCTFCEDCITPWLTENIAKCPNCAFLLK